MEWILPCPDSVHEIRGFRTDEFFSDGIVVAVYDGQVEMLSQHGIERPSVPEVFGDGGKMDDMEKIPRQGESLLQNGANGVLKERKHAVLGNHGEDMPVPGYAAFRLHDRSAAPLGLDKPFFGHALDGHFGNPDADAAGMCEVREPWQPRANGVESVENGGPKSVYHLVDEAALALLAYGEGYLSGWASHGGNYIKLSPLIENIIRTFFSKRSLAMPVQMFV